MFYLRKEWLVRYIVSPLDAVNQDALAIGTGSVRMSCRIPVDVYRGVGSGLTFSVPNSHVVELTDVM